MKIRIILLIASLTSLLLKGQAKIESQEVLIKNGDIELPGTLTSTKESKKLIIWIHGSGNVDRNGNQAGANVKANYIKQFRDQINKQNIAFFSFDKRTANPKNVPFLKGTIFDDFVDDAKKVVSHFKKNMKFDEIILTGHSQGSLVAMLAAHDADKYISIAGPAASVQKTIVAQISKQSEPLGKVASEHFNELNETGDIRTVNPFLVTIFSKPNLDFLKNWNSYNPSEEIKKLKIPVLIINGTKDLQVSIEAAKTLHESNKNSELKIIENMNHVIKKIEIDADNLKSYYSPDFPISQKLTEVITDFTKK